MSETPRYDIVLGQHDHVAAIRSGDLSSPNFGLQFHHFLPTHNAFKPMVREHKFDICEMAIVTFILAKAWKKPLVMLPATMVARFQQPFCSVNAKVEMSGPGDLAGRRVGVRSPTVTTVTWLRGILQNDHGADLDAVKWVSFEDAHVAEYSDDTERAPEHRKITDMLLDGEIDVALGERIDDPRARPLFADPQAAAHAWFEKHNIVPLNHVVVVSETMMQEHFDHVIEFYRMLERNKEMAPHQGAGPDPALIGFEALRPSVEMILSYLIQQKMVPQDLTIDDLFDARLREVIG